MKISSGGVSGVWEMITQWCLYAAVFLTPLLFLPWTLYPLSLNKQFVFITLVLLGTVSWLIKGVANGKLVFAQSPLNLLILSLLVFTALSAWFSGSRSLSFMGANGGEVDTFIAVLGFGLLYFLLASTLKNEKEIKKVFNLFLISGAVVLVYGFLQMLGWHILPWVFSQNNAFNPIGTTNALGVFLGLIFVMVMAIFYQTKEVDRTVKILLGVLAAVLFIAVFLISYWPVFVGLIATTVILTFYNMKNGKFLLPFAILAISIFVILVNLGFARFRLPVFSLPSEITPSVSASWNIAKNTLQGGAGNFIFGSGPATYQYQYGLLRDANLNATPFWNLRFSQGFNAFLTHLVDWGFLGTLLFAIFLGVILTAIIR